MERGEATEQQTAPAAPGAAATRTGPPPEEKTSVTHHSIRIDGQEVKYTATAATYVLKSDDGAPKASMFFVAYTKDDVADLARRPVSFIYNGGPGSASLLHPHGPRSETNRPHG